MIEKEIQIREKLKIIQQTTSLTQTRLADRFGVSFVAFNNWWTGKSIPREGKKREIDELYLEVTGKKAVDPKALRVKKGSLYQKSRSYKSIISEILSNPDLREEFLLKLTYNSNSIEGNTLTELDTAAVIFDNITLSNRTLIEHLEAKNHQAALNYLFDHISKKGKITEEFVLRLHGILMNSISPDAGFYRKHAVRIAGVNLATANYLKIPDLMTEIIDILSKPTKDIISVSTRVHSQFEKVHPFSDGNGRVGRLLLCAMLLRSNFSPAIIRQERKRLYYTYLYKSQTTEDQSQLENFFCDAVSEGFMVLEREDNKI